MRIFVRLLLAPPACELELPSSSTVGTLHAAVAAKLDLSYDLFLFGADGVPLDHWDAPLHRAFKYHASERKGGGTAQGVVLPETLYALPVYKAGLRRTQGTVAFGGLTSNFSAASYPLLAGGWSLQTEAGMSTACSALYVLKDCSPEVRERVVAGVSRVAATRMASAAPVASALKCLCERELLRQSQKGALLAGLLSATKVMPPRHET